MIDYSDLILEVASDTLSTLATREYKEPGGVVCRQYEVKNDRQAEDSGRKVGRYYAYEGDDGDAIALALSKQLKKELPNNGKILIIALGNPRYVADKLGTAALDRIALTSGAIELSNDHLNCNDSNPISGNKVYNTPFYKKQHFDKIDNNNNNEDGKESARKIFKLYPLCENLTNISSYNVVRATLDIVKPDLVIAIDTLATRSPSRIAKSIQLTTAGVTPGGGVGNTQPTLDSVSLNVSTIAIGTPLIVSAQVVEKDSGISHLTAANIDEIVIKSAEIIAKGINLALH